MNKQEYIDLLKKIKKEISVHNWSLHPEDYKLLDDSRMKSWMDYFNLPLAKMEHNYVFGLPEGWMAGIEEDSEDYNDVVEAYEDVYFYLLHLASAEEDVEDAVDRKDEIQANKQYINSLL